jgi:hypothetical protein
MVYDPVRETTFLFGGWSVPGSEFDSYTYYSCTDLAHPYCDGLWSWDGSAWELVEMADPLGDGAPSARIEHAMAYDTANGVAMLVGGSSNPGSGTPSDETWLLHSGGTERPGHVASFAASGELDPTRVDRIEVVWCANAIGYPGGTGTTGFSLHIWDRYRWRGLATTAATLPGFVGCLAWSSDADAAFAGADLARLFGGTGSRLYFAAKPSEPNGAGAAYGSITTTYVEASVAYQP